MSKRQRIVLVGIFDTNTVSLAPYVLKSYAEQSEISQGFEIVTKEFSIFSDSVESMISSIRLECPEVVGFSAYIWNINEVLEAAKHLDSTVIIGGPQVTGIEEKLLRENPDIDIVVTGEGEETFKELLEYFAGSRKIETISGITTRDVKTGPREVLLDLNAIPSVYERIFDEHPAITWICFETSRGCPMGCKYCTWCYSKKMRYYALERVKRDLDVVLSNENIENIYVCDSSLLLNKKRAKQILGYIIDRGTNKPIRFEFSAEQLDDELIALLSRMPDDEFNFGLQSVNENALRVMGRRFDKNRFEENYRKLVGACEKRNITIDLIYGLPGDNIEGFKESLDFAISLRHVNRILTNALIALPGSEFFREMNKYGIRLRDEKSYLVLKNSTFSEEQMELARRYSFYVSVVYCNSRLTDCIKYLAEYQDRRYIDTIIQFMETLDLDIVGEEYPDMLPAIAEGYKQRNSAFRKVVEKYDDIVYYFNEFSGHKYDNDMADFRDHFSEQYYKLKRFAWGQK